jgi:hypothetical protein
MKIQISPRQDEPAVAVERKNQPARGGTKTSVHRYERRKIREQLRHLDWALPGVD